VNNIPREQLKQLICQYGRSISEDPKRCEALLRDFCGQYRKEINVLVSAVKESIPVDLNNSQRRVPSDVLLAKLTKRLEDRLAIDPAAARWAVESWAIALGLITEENRSIEENKNIVEEQLNSEPPRQQSSSNRSPAQVVNNPPDVELESNVAPQNGKTTQTAVKNKINFLKLIIPAIAVAFVGYGISQQSHPNRDSLLVGSWQELTIDGSVAIVDFKSNGRFTFQQSLSKSQVSNGENRFFESHGTYQMTGEGWVVQTIQEARIGSNGNWDYCPSQSNSNHGCDVAFNGLEKELNRPKQVKIEMDTSNQQLDIGNQKYRRFR
jgi:hypothetical protein